MHFSTLALPLVALFATVHAAGPTVTVFQDAACTKQLQVISLENDDEYHCYDFSSLTAQGAILSKGVLATKGFNVWDSQYCAGDPAGSVSTLGTCLSAADYGLAAWKSAHISPRVA